MLFQRGGGRGSAKELKGRLLQFLTTNRALNNWNSLDRHVVSAESISSLKRQLDESMDRDDRWDG